MRNQTNYAICHKTKNASWYKTLPISNQNQNQDSVNRAKQLANKEVNGRAICDDDIVCRLMFGFWAYMYDAPYRNTQARNSFIWDPHILLLAFPNY